MANPRKRQGDNAEREAERLLSDLLGVAVRRKLGAGRRDDMGDLDGVPGTCVQVYSRQTDPKPSELQRKLAETESQRHRMGAARAVLLVRLRGGVWRAITVDGTFNGGAVNITAPEAMPIHDALRWLPELRDDEGADRSAVVEFPQLAFAIGTTLDLWAEAWREITGPGDTMAVGA